MQRTERKSKAAANGKESQAPGLARMSTFRPLVERLYLAHMEVTEAWNTFGGRSRKDSRQVAEPRNKFREAQTALFGELAALDQPFLAGDSKAIDAILDFAEVDIPAFRCGYAKQKYFRKLKSLTLNKMQQERLRRLGTNLCRGPHYGRELVDLARLMIRLADVSLIRELEQLSNDNVDDLIRKKSQRMLDVILHNRQDLRSNTVSQE